MATRALKSAKRLSLKGLAWGLSLALLLFLIGSTIVLLKDWHSLDRLVVEAQTDHIPKALLLQNQTAAARELALWVDSAARGLSDNDKATALALLSTLPPLHTLTEPLTTLIEDGQDYHAAHTRRNSQISQAHVIMISSDLVLGSLIDKAGQTLRQVAALGLEDTTPLIQAMRRYSLLNRLQSVLSTLYGHLSLIPAISSIEDTLSEQSYYHGLLLVGQGILNQLQNTPYSENLQANFDDFSHLHYLFAEHLALMEEEEALDKRAAALIQTINATAFSAGTEVAALAAQSAKAVASHGQAALNTALIALLVLGCGFIGAGMAVQFEVVRPIRQASLALEDLSSNTAVTSLAPSDLREIDAINQAVRRLHSAWAEIAAANERLIAMAQLKSQFTSSVSHELRTPLTSIRGFIKLIRRDFKAEGLEDTSSRKIQRMARNLDIVAAESERLSLLIDDVLDIAKIESGESAWRDTDTDIQAVITKTEAAISGELAIKPDVSLHITVDSPLPTLTVDGHRLQQVLLNLLNNAIKFTPKGTIHLHCRHQHDQVLFRVSDEGIGIPESDFEKIFEKFEQASNSNDLTDKPRGTGLGLAICRQIIEHYGGKIWVESTIGAGSTFSFFLPAGPKHA